MRWYTQSLSDWAAASSDLTHLGQKEAFGNIFIKAVFVE